MQDASLHVSASSDGTNTRGRRSTTTCPSASSMVSGGGALLGVTKTIAGKSQLRIHSNSLLRSSRRVVPEPLEISPSHQAPSKSACTISRDHPSWGAEYSEISAKDSSGLVMGNISPPWRSRKEPTRVRQQAYSRRFRLSSGAKRENCAPPCWCLSQKFGPGSHQPASFLEQIAASVAGLDLTTCASAISAISLEKFVRSAAQSRKTRLT